jgi:hypothetical protein
MSNKVVLGVIIVTLLLGISTGAMSAVDLVRQGKAVATIVIPDNALESVSYAAQELQYHVEESTGATLPIVKESQKPQSGNLVILGLCNATSEAGIDPNKIAPNGFTVKLIGSNLYMAGRDNQGPLLGMYNTTSLGTLFAVYEFLEKQMSVRWLWPGKLGEAIPKAQTISVKKWAETSEPQIVHKRLRDGGPYQGNEAAWSSAQAMEDYTHDQSVWLRRQRFANAMNLDIHHSFTEYWKRFGTTHPDYFNLLPDGTRRPDPSYAGGSGEFISMSVSNPALWAQIIADWQKSRSESVPFVDASENDTGGKCTCEGCMAWDVPPPGKEDWFAGRLQRAKAAFEKTNVGSFAGWDVDLGNLADRYCKFYVAVQEESKKVDPNTMVMGLAYANYSKPPIKAKLNDKILIAIVPEIYFPWTEEKIKLSRQQWEGWANTGCKLMLRPNYFLDGHAMPVFFARKFGREFNFDAKHGLMATDFDSLTGQWATQGPNLYVLARLHTHPDWSPDKVLGEYYKGFGPASGAVKAYFAHWERVSDGVTDKLMQDMAKKYGESDWARFYRGAHMIFTPEVMAEGDALLAKAIVAAKGDAVAEQRVAFLEKGLRNAELTLATQQAYLQYKAKGDLAGYTKALETLDAYRASIDNDDVANMGYLAWSEGHTWDRSFVKLMKRQGQPFSAKWKFMWDVTEDGDKKSWQNDSFDDSSWFDIGVDTVWEDQPVGKQWRAEHKSDYDGIAWYRTTVSLDPAAKGHHIGLIFGAVDEACKVWVNGTLLLDRPFPYKGNVNSWQEAFDVDFTSVARFDRPNTIAVRVEDRSGAGGIWKPVYLTVEQGK